MLFGVSVSYSAFSPAATHHRPPHIGIPPPAIRGTSSFTDFDMLKGFGEVAKATARAKQGRTHHYSVVNRPVPSCGDIHGVDIARNALVGRSCCKHSFVLVRVNYAQAPRECPRQSELATR